MQKISQCRCGYNVRLPNPQCLYQCKGCGIKGIFLCHIIQNTDDLMRLRCKPCKNVFSMFQCPQCEATAVIKSYKSGHVYGCVCGFLGTFLSCNKCTSLICLPAKNNYQKSQIKCQKCASLFTYTVCTQCQECNYFQTGQPISSNQCYNEDCSLYSKKQNNIPQKQTNAYELYPGVEQNPKRKQNESNNCIICVMNQSCMINTSCFHMSTCENCSKNLRGVCPMCRANGDFKKVYRS